MKLDTETIDALRTQLEQEAAILEVELTDIATEDTLNTDDWHGTAGTLETGTADPQVLADRVEESLTNEGIASTLETRYANIKKALVRITDGTYGTCSSDGCEIPLERLRANPAADTCLTHEPTQS